MYQRPEPLIPEGYSGTALRGENLQPPPPPPPKDGGREELLLLVLLLLVAKEGERGDGTLALILAALLLLGRGDPGRLL